MKKLFIICGLVVVLMVITIIAVPMFTQKSTSAFNHTIRGSMQDLLSWRSSNDKESTVAVNQLELPEHIGTDLKKKKSLPKLKTISEEVRQQLLDQLAKQDSDIKPLIHEYNENLGDLERRAELEEKFAVFAEQYKDKLGKVIEDQLARESVKQ